MLKKASLLIIVLIFIAIGGVAGGSLYLIKNNVTSFSFIPPIATTTTGTIKGKVDVGPICPVERIGVPCPVPPEAYTSREVMLYAANGVTVVQSMHFMADGTYAFKVLPGTYVLDIPRQGKIGGTSDLPKTFVVDSGQVIDFNFSIDTGIR